MEKVRFPIMADMIKMKFHELAMAASRCDFWGFGGVFFTDGRTEVALEVGA